MKINMRSNETIRQKKDRERGEYKRKRRKKYLLLKHLEQYIISKRKRSGVRQKLKNIKPIMNNEEVNPIATEKSKNYSYKRTLSKGIKYIIIYGLSFLITGFLSVKSDIAGLTLGTLLIMLLNFLKVKMGVRIP